MIHRLHPFILITGTLLSLLTAAAFVASAWWVVSVQIPSGLFARFQSGTVSVGFNRYSENLVRETDHSLGLREWNVWWRPYNWAWMRIYVTVPLYAVFLAVAVPTLLVWRFWPKPVKPGHCRCGYDLTGNTSGVCPECGVEVQA